MSAVADLSKRIVLRMQVLPKIVRFGRGGSESSWAALWRFLGGSWAALGRLWAALGGLWASLGGSGRLLGGSWAGLGGPLAAIGYWSIIGCVLNNS